MIKFYSISKKLTLLLALVLQSVCSFSQVIGMWSNSITGTNPNTDNPYTNGQVGYLSVSGIGRGSGINGVNANNRYNANGWNSTFLDTADYFYFTLKNNPGNTWGFVVNEFVFTSQVSTTGPTSFSVRYSLDNFASDLGTTTASGDTILFSNNSGYIPDSITFKIYAWGATASNGTYSINDFEFHGAVPLSITFENFAATKKNNTAVLSWKLGGTDEGEKIAVQHSTDGKNFTTLKTVEQEVLSFIHETPAKGTNYYRLQSIQANGKSNYTNMVSVFFDNKDGLNIYPNPAKNELHITTKDNIAIKSVRVYNALGFLVFQSQNTENNTLNTSNFPTGIYTINAILNDNTETVQTFVIEKNM